MFKIIVAGWQCAHFITETLDSIDIQGRRDFEVFISYEMDPDDGGCWAIDNWIKTRREPRRYHTSFREGTENFLYGTRARYEAIQQLNCDDDDVLIWLNLDGDRFAHRQVLDRVWDAYFVDNFPLLTFGSFRCEPPIAAPLEAMPYDNAVIAANSYRSAPFRAADLRTMQYKVWKTIPVSEQQWSDGRGWYSKCDDVSSMVPALERVGIRHRFIPHVLMQYNTLNPLSGVTIPGGAEETTAHLADIRSKPTLEQLW